MNGRSATSASALSIEEFENAVSPLFESISLAAAKGEILDEKIFDKLSGLLTSVGKPAWADRPRTYTVLRLINRIDAMNFFVFNGFLDIQLPYSDRRLPGELTGSCRHMFLEKQSIVLTGANELELEKGRHRHLNVDGDTFFMTLNHLGAGKFGRVDHVRSKLSLEEYARKRIARARTFTGDKAAMRMFENELTNLKRLRHHHLVTFVGSYTDQRYIGMLTTPVAECDLQQFLQKGPSNPSLLRQFFGCLCSAVQYLHSQKCRHKDIKPGNILVRKGTVFVTDFGTALDWSDKSRGSTSGTTGPFTPRFAAPEVLSCGRRNESSDIWSLGCVYLDMMTVIKGKRIDDMFSFFEDHGTGHRTASNNMDALEQWLANLESTGSSDKAPVSWIRSMLQHSPIARPNATELLDVILLYEDEHLYYGDCCTPEEDCCSTYQGSVFAAGGFLTPDPTDSSIQLVQHFDSNVAIQEADLASVQPLTTVSADAGLVEVGPSQARTGSESSPEENTDQTIVPEESRDASPAQDSASTLMRLDTKKLYGQMEQDFQNARKTIEQIAIQPWTTTRLFSIPGPVSCKETLEIAPFKHWDRKLFSVAVSGRPFDTFAFGHWFCRCVASSLGTTGLSFNLAGRIWLAILVLELRIVMQIELLHISETTNTKSRPGFTFPWIIVETDMDEFRKIHNRCKKAWDTTKTTLLEFSDLAYEDAANILSPEVHHLHSTQSEPANSQMYIEMVLQHGLSSLFAEPIGDLERHYAEAWFSLPQDMLSYTGSLADTKTHKPVNEQPEAPSKDLPEPVLESERISPDSSFSCSDESDHCTRCREILEEGVAWELAGKRWHINCFLCTSCGTLLDGDANLLLLGDGSLLCNNCIYSCNACGNKIEDIAILAGEQAFCAGCFRCRNCKEKIEDLRYARTSQGIFCRSCHEQLLARRRKKMQSSLSVPDTKNSSHPGVGSDPRASKELPTRNSNRVSKFFRSRVPRIVGLRQPGLDSLKEVGDEQER